MSEIEVTIIMPYWQTPEALCAFWREFELPPSWECLIVNNHSHLPNDLKLPKNCRVITLAQNKGFAAACNRGAQEARGSKLLFVNADVVLRQADVLGLLRELEVRRWVAVAPTILTTDGLVDQGYAKPIPSFWALVSEFTPVGKLLPQTLFGRRTLPGACLLIEKSVLDVIGGWDERFFVWFEDSDLSKKLLDGGYNFGVSRAVAIHHQGGASFEVLSNDTKRVLFFAALRAYGDSHFSVWQNCVLRKIAGHYSSAQLLPPDGEIVVSVVVPNVRRELLQTFLEENIHCFNFEHHELIVVTSAACADLKTQYPQVVFIQLQNNRGFAHTVNVGLRRARGTWVGTVNDDVILYDKWLEVLVESAETSSGSISPHITAPSGSTESLGVEVLSDGRARPITTPNTKQRVDAFNAAAVLLNRQALEAVGLFDERFGSYLEDVDLGLRMGSAGWKHQVVPEVTITHRGHTTSAAWPVKKAWQDVKNWWLVVLKNRTFFRWSRNWWDIVLERGRNVSGLVKTLAATE